ncbi:hypothetical protein [Microbacterium sp. R86528]|uniref:hypothetical protein n=1 Tax=Microbacterium sp. R86528 TaxID=3093864 RepID=UPI0037C6C0DB
MISLPIDPLNPARPPAPEWLLNVTSETKAASKAHAQAKDTAEAARKAHSAAIGDFREASRRAADGDWTPLPSVAYDHWRQLQNVVHDTERASKAAERDLKHAWIAVRSTLVDAPEVTEKAEAVTHERHAALVAKLDEIDKLLVSFAEASTLTPSLYARKEGMMRYALDADLKRALGEVRTIVAPRKGWTSGGAK